MIMNNQEDISQARNYEALLSCWLNSFFPPFGMRILWLRHTECEWAFHTGSIGKLAL